LRAERQLIEEHDRVDDDQRARHQRGRGGGILVPEWNHAWGFDVVLSGALTCAAPGRSASNPAPAASKKRPENTRGVQEVGFMGRAVAVTGQNFDTEVLQSA